MRLGSTLNICTPSTSNRIPFVQPTRNNRRPERSLRIITAAALAGGNREAEHVNTCHIPTNEEPTQTRVAWNKGLAISESTRRKLSSSFKKKWKDPDFRDKVTAAMKGKEAWNKGISVSEETREKMRLAKLNHSVSRATRQKMSEARLGRSLSPEAAALVSQKLSGKPKSEEHRQRIAAAQRRRHAAARVLTAVETVYQQTSESGNIVATGGASSSNSSSNNNNNKTTTPSVLGHTPPSPNSSSSISASSLPGIINDNGKRQPKSAFLNSFKSELREFRALQEELSPWVKAFEEKTGRKPSLADVHRTGIEWLWTRYKRYILLRQRLFSDTSLLRSKVSTTTGGSSSNTHQIEGNNINNVNSSINSSTSTPPPGLGARLSAVADYKLSKRASSKQALAGMDASLGSTSSESDIDEDSLENKLISAGPNIPARVKHAMQTAIDYRHKKAQATREAVDAAVHVAKTMRNSKAVVGAAKKAAATGMSSAALGASPMNTSTSDIPLPGGVVDNNNNGDSASILDEESQSSGIAPAEEVVVFST